MSLFIHGCVNLCDVMRCGTLSSMIRWHPLLKNVQTSFMLLHVVKLLITVSDRSLHISLIFRGECIPWTNSLGPLDLGPVQVITCWTRWGVFLGPNISWTSFIVSQAGEDHYTN